ncbi:MAG: glucuronate isomerase [Verrucomicrobiota bacterium]
MAQKKQLADQVEKIVQATPIIDIHTHLYDPAFGKLLLWGIDDLLVYHYLVSESFRYFDLPYEDFWGLSKTDQASLIWDALFIKHSPISEACRGVLTVLNALELDVKKRDLRSLRKWFVTQKPAAYITRCMKLANVKSIYMTNSPFDDSERPIWEKGFARDDRFTAALRIDPLLLNWPETATRLAAWGYNVTPSLSQKTFSEVRRFLADWSKKLQARYLMISLPPEFTFPAKNDFNRLIEEAILPHCRDFNLPFALMPGVRRAVNPPLRLAGDGVGLSNMTSLANLCVTFPENRFLTTVLARENQHELCVLARKFRNLHIFGCWWFMNVPTLIDETTRLRLEMIGLSVTPQHSDARVLDQIIYKWQHSKKIIGNVLTDKYSDLADTGWRISRDEMQRDVTALFGGAFEEFCRGN